MQVIIRRYEAPRLRRRVPASELPSLAHIHKASPQPTDIVLHQQSRKLEVAFDDGARFQLPCELLRVYSPSAEVRGHGPGQEVLQIGKRDVNITAIDPVGAYAVKLSFSDGHDTGLYTWDYLHHLGVDADALWQQYLQRLTAVGASRDASARVEVHKLRRMDPPARFNRPPSDE